MALIPRRSLIRALVRWQYDAVSSLFGSTPQREQHVGRDVFPDAAVYNHVFAATYTIAASGTQVVDFRGPFTAPNGQSVTAAKIVAVFVQVTASVLGAALRIEPDATNGLVWPWSSSGMTDTPRQTITPDGSGNPATWLQADGVSHTLDGSHKRWLLTNSGTQSLNVTVIAYVGT